MELEERSIEELPDRCQNCGSPLTKEEKQTALDEGATTVLCKMCAAEMAPYDEAEELEADY